MGEDMEADIGHEHPGDQSLQLCLQTQDLNQVFLFFVTQADLPECAPGRAKVFAGPFCLSKK